MLHNALLGSPGIQWQIYKCFFGQTDNTYTQTVASQAGIIHVRAYTSPAENEDELSETSNPRLLIGPMQRCTEESIAQIAPQHFIDAFCVIVSYLSKLYLFVKLLYYLCIKFSLYPNYEYQNKLTFKDTQVEYPT